MAPPPKRNFTFILIGMKIWANSPHFFAVVWRRIFWNFYEEIQSYLRPSFSKTIQISPNNPPLTHPATPPFYFWPLSLSWRDGRRAAPAHVRPSGYWPPFSRERGRGRAHGRHFHRRRRRRWSRKIAALFSDRWAGARPGRRRGKLGHQRWPGKGERRGEGARVEGNRWPGFFVLVVGGGSGEVRAGGWGYVSKNSFWDVGVSRVSFKGSLLSDKTRRIITEL